MDNEEKPKASVGEQTKCLVCGRRFGEMEDELVKCSYCDLLACPNCSHTCYNCFRTHCSNCGCHCLDYTR